MRARPGASPKRECCEATYPELSDETSSFVYIMQLLYNDLSPMENHHSAAAFGIMRQPGNNFMDHLPRKVRCRRAGAGAGTTNGRPEGREGAWSLRAICPQGQLQAGCRYPSREDVPQCTVLTSL